MKRIMIAAALLSAVLMLGSCGSDNNSSVGNGGAETTAAGNVQQEKEVSAAEILGSIDNELLDGKAVKGEDMFDKNAEKFYGITIDKISDGGILYNSEGSYCDEVSIIRLADDPSAEDILKKRLEDRHATFSGYAPEQMPKFEEAEVFVQNGYGVLIISEDHEKIARQIKDMLK